MGLRLNELFSTLKSRLVSTVRAAGSTVSKPPARVSEILGDVVRTTNRKDVDAATKLRHATAVERGEHAVHPVQASIQNPSPGLGAALDENAAAHAARSPTLLAQLADLEALGIQITYGPQGGGSYADRGLKLIVIDNSLAGNPGHVIRALAHEVGHMHPSNKTQRMLPHNGESKQEWAAMNVEHALLDEGQATFNEAQVLWEIARTDGPYTPVAGTHSLEYELTYDSFCQGKISRDAAIAKMAALHADETISISSTGRTYQDYFTEIFENDFDHQGFGLPDTGQ
ncbi:hypothetical protein ACFROC_05455 [Nocardia tengchongensis]|uniref:hypothetical protein n=1 Tax=Nocardia tengchongensis TaxID=2055889 RepID=UPI00367DF105